METIGPKELEALRGMVLAWRASYFRQAPPHERPEYLFLADDYMGEIEEIVYPYVRRLSQCSYINANEAKEFLEFCYLQVEELRNSLMEADGKEEDKGFWHVLAEE